MKAEPVTFRTLTEADLPILEAYFPEPSPGAHKKRLARQQRGLYLYSCAVVGKTIAAVQLVRWQKLKIPARYQNLYPYPEIGSLFVLPAFRRQKIATQLLAYNEAKIKERGYGGSILMIQNNNAASIQLHQAYGYKAVGAAEPNKTSPTTPRSVYVKRFEILK